MAMPHLLRRPPKFRIVAPLTPDKLVFVHVLCVILPGSANARIVMCDASLMAARMTPRFGSHGSGPILPDGEKRREDNRGVYHERRAFGGTIIRERREDRVEMRTRAVIHQNEEEDHGFSPQASEEIASMTCGSSACSTSRGINSGEEYPDRQGREPGNSS